MIYRIQRSEISTLKTTTGMTT